MGDAYTELLPASGMLSNNEEYYPTVALNALMNALRNPAAAAHQAEVFNAMFTILKTLGLASVPYLPKVGLLHVAYTLNIY
jgi:serine/threonine-protein kinase mTOR